MLAARSSRIFVTGATGYVGSYFVSEWLRAKRGEVFCLVRDKGSQSGPDRLTAALKMAQTTSGACDEVPKQALTCISGDITLPLLGVAPEGVADLRRVGIDAFWHFASNLRYEDHNFEETRRINVIGASNALALAVSVGVMRFVYVSTAFVSGRQSGLIEEAPVPLHREFSNGYEASKAEAERLLTAECERLGLPLTILRPSIVVGPRTTKSACGSDTGLFSLIQAVLWVRRSTTGRIPHLRVPARPDAEINFVPVDCVASDMLALEASDFGDKSIYHLSSNTSISVRNCWQIISDALGMSNIELIQPEAFEPNPAERFIARRISFFLSYIGVDRNFVRSLSSVWNLTASDFSDYVQMCLERVNATERGTDGHAG